MENFSRRIYYEEANGKLVAKNSESNVLNKESIAEKKKIAIFGATGGTGLALIEEATRKGHKVVAAVRNPASLEKYKEKIEIRIININDKATILEAVKDCDVIISTLGSGNFSESKKPTTLYSKSAKLILDAMITYGIKRCLFVTSGGVEDDQGAPMFYRKLMRPLLINNYLDMIKMETIIECEGKSLDWTIVRPSWLRDGASKNFHATERLIRRGNFQINRIDVAKFMIHEIENGLWVRGYPTLSYS